MAERTVVVSSLSKSHAAAGVPPRLGGRAAGADRHLANLLLCMTYGSPAFIQYGALAALRDELPEVAALREDYRGARGADVGSARRRAGLPRRSRPKAACSCCWMCAAPGSAPRDFARRLLDSERVAVLPCDGFGPSAAGHLRIALSAPEARLRDAAERILRFARGLNRPR